MLVIFPFEHGVYEGTGMDVEFVGHPLLEALADQIQSPLPRTEDTVLLLPGSRESEVRRLLPSMLAAAELLHREQPEIHFVIAVPREVIADKVRTLIQRHQSTDLDVPIRIEVGHTRQWLQRAAAGIAASGTVTVEAAILGLPLVVAYRLHWFTYQWARLLVKLPHFTMVNLVAGETVFEEFLQNEVTPENLLGGLKGILPGGKRRQEALAGIERTVEALGGTQQVSGKAAAAVLELVAEDDSPADDTASVNKKQDRCS
jgi:lipid-A-disaccharide synthase